MANPIQLVLSLNQAWIEAWLSSASLMVYGWSRIIDLDGQASCPAGTKHPRRAEIDQGPTFTGKYGRRRFDVDPERDI